MNKTRGQASKSSLRIKVPPVTAGVVSDVRSALHVDFKRGASERDTPFAFIAPDAKAARRYEAMIRKAFPNKEIDAVIVIGIGGSSLGAQAVCGALGYAGQFESIPVIFCDTIASITSGYCLTALSSLAQQGASIIVCIVSKSGKTTETIVNARLLCQELMHCYGQGWAKHVVVLSQEDTALFRTGHQNGSICVPLNPHIGGRFSVLSLTGLVPLALAGYDIEQLVAGAQLVTRQVLDDQTDDAHTIAQWLCEQYYIGMVIHDLFLFEPTLELVGKWYRQLVAESLGKKNDAGTPTGITPTVSIGTNDLHSMVQLYLAGPNNRCTSFIRVVDQGPTFDLATEQPFSAVLPGLDGFSNSEIYTATLQGTMRAYKQAGRAYNEIVFDSISGKSLGQFFQLQMVATVYLAHMLKVNPFDQPNVEQYKAETRKVLASE